MDDTNGFIKAAKIDPNRVSAVRRGPSSTMPASSTVPSAPISALSEISYLGMIEGAGMPICRSADALQPLLMRSYHMVIPPSLLVSLIRRPSYCSTFLLSSPFVLVPFVHLLLFPSYCSFVYIYSVRSVVFPSFDLFVAR